MKSITVANFLTQRLTYTTVEIRFERRDYGGWYLVRADNQRKLGWLYRSTTERKWTAYVSASAFRGSSLDDEGDVLDTVDPWVAGTIAEARLVGTDSSRTDAAESLVAYLVNHAATAITGEPSHYCTTYASRRSHT
jgi:hypothetical protein